MNRKLSVRRAFLRDIDVLVHQRRYVFESMGFDVLALKQLDHEYRRWARRRLRNGTLKAWVVENREREAVGGGVLWLRPSARAPPNSGVQPYLTSMYTQQKYRGKGVASLVVREAIKWTRANGYRSIVIHASKMARTFYPRFGFRRTWEMECKLT